MDKKNVIVVMLDSLSWQYLGSYGNKWIKTPNLDRLAKEGVVFENNYIEGLPTIPCRRSMLTGRYWVDRAGWCPLELDEITVGDLCWGKGIDTALVFDCAPLNLPLYGYKRGFDKVWYLHGHELEQAFYHNDPAIHLKVEDFFEDRILADRKDYFVQQAVHEVEDFIRHRQYWKTEEDQNVPRVMKKAVQYLENIDRNKQFFLWVDSFDPHEPWDPPSVYDPNLPCPYDPDYKGKDMMSPPFGEASRFTEAELNHIRMLYAEKVTMCDRWVGYLLDNVRRLGLEEDTLFLLVSDHGEPLGHNEHGHGQMRKLWTQPYDELGHAPMIMRGPGIPAGKRISSFTQSCDVAPTVADWLGLGTHPYFTGKSLVPLAKGEVDKVRDLAITGHFNKAWCLHTEEYSYMHWQTPEHRQKRESYHIPDFASYFLVRHDGMGPVPADKDMFAATKAFRQGAMAFDETIWKNAPTKKGGYPTNDELYDRKADIYQLNDIAGKEPKKAAEMYKTLMDFMNSLRNSPPPTWTK